MPSSTLEPVGSWRDDARHCYARDHVTGAQGQSAPAGVLAREF